MDRNGSVLVKGCWLHTQIVFTRLRQGHVRLQGAGVVVQNAYIHTNINMNSWYRMYITYPYYIFDITVSSQ
jgi:hypothetical protein